jgi:hypothetical protein
MDQVGPDHGDWAAPFTTQKILRCAQAGTCFSSIYMGFYKLVRGGSRPAPRKTGRIREQLRALRVLHGAILTPELAAAPNGSKSCYAVRPKIGGAFAPFVSRFVSDLGV